MNNILSTVVWSIRRSPRAILLLCFALLQAGCASREVLIFDENGATVGSCVAGYDWHLYGLQDSIDYTLYQCAQPAIVAGRTLSDPILQYKDFRLPEAPQGKTWNKKLAMAQFHSGKISERRLGYLLADLEHAFRKRVGQAEDDLSSGKIDEAKFEAIVSAAEQTWLGE